MVRTMKRMLCAQLGVGFKAWLINTNTGKHKDKGAMTMIKTMKRMLAAQVGAGWSKWFQFILDQRREEEERTLEGALEGRRTAEQHARQMKEQWDRIKVSLETVSERTIRQPTPPHLHHLHHLYHFDFLYHHDHLHHSPYPHQYFYHPLLTFRMSHIGWVKLIARPRSSPN